MKYLLKGLTLLTVLSIALLACTPNNVQPSYSIDDFNNCNQGQSLDSLGNDQSLIGTWDLKLIYNFWTDDEYAPTGFTQITFKPDHTFEVVENSGVTQTGTWAVVKLEGIYWTVKTSPIQNDLIRGRILFCNNFLMMGDSYIDGKDHLFRRKQP